MRSSAAGTTELLSLALTLNLPSCHIFLSDLLSYSLFEGAGFQSKFGGAKTNLLLSPSVTAQEEVRGAEAAPGPPQPEPRARQHGACQLATVRRVFQLPGNLRAESRRRRQVLPLVREFRSKCIIS